MRHEEEVKRHEEERQKAKGMRHEGSCEFYNRFPSNLRLAGLDRFTYRR
jgi:hypothetical protein